MSELMNLLGDINNLAAEQSQIIDDGFFEYSGRTDTDWVADKLPAEITLRGYQMAAVEAILKFKRGILGFEPGMGKRLAEGTPILTPNGWFAIESLKIGDLVIGQDGTAYPVTGIFHEEDRPLYRVTFQDDTWIDADDEHLWTAKLYAKGNWKEVTTQEILNYGLKDQDGKRKWRIPMANPITGFTDQSLNDDPYILGVVAGDGSVGWEYRNSNKVRWDINTDLEILEAIEATNIKTEANDCDYNADGAVILTDLAPASSAFKKIPASYLLGSLKERHALLQGLLDTDGSPIETGGIEFCSTSTHLVDAVCELTRSLGGIVNNRFPASSDFTYNGENKTGLPAERVNIKLPANVAPFRLKRKLDLWVPPTKYNPVKIIDSIERIENGPGYCIAIDSPDHLYVAKDYIVTHNTPTALTVIANTVGKAIIVIPPSLTYDPWTKEIKRLFPDLTFEVLTGRTPWEIDDGTNIVIVGDSVVSNWEKVLIDWDASIVVVDEAQRHKNPKAQRAAATANIAESVRNNNGTVIELTGTLATNAAHEVWMPANIAGIAKTISGKGTHKAWNNKWCFMDDMPVEMYVKDSDGKKKSKKQVWIQVPKGCKDPMGLHDALRQTAYIRVQREDVVDMPDKMLVQHSVTGSAKGLKEYNNILNHFEEWYVKQGGDIDKIKGSEKLVQLGKLIEAAALAKIDAAAEYVSALVEQQEQVVVMAHHKAAVRAFQNALDATSVTFTGSESPQQKADAVEKFKSGKAQVFIGNISSAGVGLNLENACHLVFIQFPWSPAEFIQASDRIYRITQERKCTIHSLFLDNSVEEHVLTVLENKGKITEAINAGIPASDMDDSSVFDDVMEMM